MIGIYKHKSQKLWLRINEITPYKNGVEYVDYDVLNDFGITEQFCSAKIEIFYKSVLPEYNFVPNKTKLVDQAERQTERIRKRFLTTTERAVCDKLQHLYCKSIERVFRRREM